MKKLEECFKRHPYNLGFGTYLYLQRGEGPFKNGEQCLKDVLHAGIRPCDVLRLSSESEQLFSEGMAPQFESEHMKVPEKTRSTYLKFAKELIKSADKVSGLRKDITKLLKAVNAGNLS